MKKAAASALFVFLTLAGAAPALADCYQVADQVAAQYQAEVLLVKEKGGNCVITLRIPGQGGQPPRVEIKEVPN